MVSSFHKPTKCWSCAVISGTTETVENRLYIKTYGSRISWNHCTASALCRLKEGWCHPPFLLSWALIKYFFIWGTARHCFIFLSLTWLGRGRSHFFTTFLNFHMKQTESVPFTWFWQLFIVLKSYPTITCWLLKLGGTEYNTATLAVFLFTLYLQNVYINVIFSSLLC